LASLTHDESETYGLFKKCFDTQKAVLWVAKRIRTPPPPNYTIVVKASFSVRVNLEEKRLVMSWDKMRSNMCLCIKFLEVSILTRLKKEILMWSLKQLFVAKFS
jgi:hypothetical protein